MLRSPGSGGVADRVEAIEHSDGTGDLELGTVVVSYRSARGCDQHPGAGGLVGRVELAPTGQRSPKSGQGGFGLILRQEHGAQDLQEGGIRLRSETRNP